MSNHEDPGLAPLISRTLGKLRGRIRRYVSIEGLALAVAWLGTAFWISLALDWGPVTFGRDELAYGARVAVLAVAAAVFLFVLFWLIGRRAFIAMSDRNMAVLLERRFNDYDDALMTTVEMADEPEHAAAFNPDMLRYTSEQALDRTGNVQLARVFNLYPLLRNAMLAAALVLSVVGFALAAPSSFNTWVDRFLLLDDAAKWPRRNRVAIEGPQVRKIARGDDVTVIVKSDVNFEVPSSVRVDYRSDDGASRSDTCIREGDPREGFQFFTYTFRGLLDSVNFDVVGGDYAVRGYRIEVVDSPTVKVSLNVEYPDYLDMPGAAELPVTGVMSFFAGSRLVVNAEANKPLVAARVEVAYSSPDLKDESHDAVLDSPRRFSFTLPPLAEEQTLAFYLEDADGIRTRQPVRLALAVTPDAIPEVEVRPKGIGLFVTPAVRIPFEGKVSDDHGVVDVWAEYQVESQPSVQVPFKQDKKKLAVLTYPRIVNGMPEDVAVDFRELAFAALRSGRLEREGLDEPVAAPNPGEEDETPEEAPPSDDPAEKKQPEDKQPMSDVLDSIAKYELKPGQKILLVVRAQDACNIGQLSRVGNSQRYVLEVVTPEELRAKLAARELILRQRFEQIRDELTVTRDSLGEITFDLEKASGPAPKEDENTEGEKKKDGAKKDGAKNDGSEPGDEEGRKLTLDDLHKLASLRAQRGQQISAKNAHEVLGVSANFDEIRAELINNRVYTEELNKRLKDGIIDPLNHIGGEMFDELDKRLADLEKKVQKEFAGPAARDAAVKDAIAEADKTLVEMDSVLAKMLEFEHFNEAIRLIREILEDQDKLNSETNKYRRDKVLKGE